MFNDDKLSDCYIKPRHITTEVKSKMLINIIDANKKGY